MVKIQDIGSRSNYVKAAYAVLIGNSKKEKMHYKDITEEAIKLEFEFDSNTPERSMHARICIDIRRRERLGKQQILKKFGDGFFGLAVKGQSADESNIEDVIEIHNDKIKKEIKKRLLEMHHGRFEDFIADELLPQMGFIESSRTQPSRDGGIDVNGMLAITDDIKIKFAVQAKRWKGNVGSVPVSNFRGSIGDHVQGMIITTSKFNKGAIDNAERTDAKKISLVNVDAIIELMFEHRIAVNHSTARAFQIDEKFSYFNNTKDKS